MTVDKSADGTINLRCFAGLLDLVRESTGWSPGEEIGHILRLSVRVAANLEHLAVGDIEDVAVAKRILATEIERPKVRSL